MEARVLNGSKMLSVRPAAAAGDPWCELNQQARSRRLYADAAEIACKVGKPDRLQIERSMEIFAGLAQADQQDILLHPLWGAWSNRLAALRRNQKWAEAECWARHLPRFLIVPAASHGLANGWRVRVPSSGGLLRFPGIPRHVNLRGEAEIEIEAQNDALHLCSGSIQLTVTLEELTGKRQSELVVERPQIDGVEIDASDPWYRGFFRTLRDAEPEKGYPRRDVRPHDPPTQHEIETIAQAFSTVRTAWPELHEEIRSHIRTFVPFESELLVGWTHVTFLGAIFIRAIPGDLLFTLERLVHEASHVRLYLMSIQPPYRSGQDLLIYSPFRKDPRPVGGVFHAAFVYCRLIEFLRRAYRALGDERMLARAQELLPLCRDAMSSVRASGAINELGNSLLDELDLHLEAAP